MSLFPMIQPQTVESQTLPLCRDVAWDFEQNGPRFRNGQPVMVTGKEAVLGWACRALQVPHTRHEMYTWAYGNACESLIGSAFTEDLKQAEAARYVRECLLVNPYIRAVRGVVVTFEDGRLQIAFEIETIYGEVNGHVGL